MKKNKFTFKTENPTGKWKSFDNPIHYIKFNKTVVGNISLNEQEIYQIYLMVIKKDINEDKNPNCEWKWILLKQESQTLDFSKEWLNENIDLILSKYTLIQQKL